MNIRFRIFVFVCLASAGLSCGAERALGQAMSSTNYKVEIDSVNFGGTRSTSGSYGAEDTLGESATGISSSASYGLSAGYQQKFGTDTTPPSIPANLSATAVSSSEIDLSWDPSTDDVGILGYRIFRDAVFLATTSASAFSDLGLTPETAYTYTVEAFDTSLNLSGQSSPATATTTVAPPPPPSPQPPARSGGGGSIGHGGSQLIIFGATLVRDRDRALIRFETTMPAQSRVIWGKTPQFEAGSLSLAAYETSHQLEVRGLEPGAQYYFRVIATNYLGFTVYIDVPLYTLGKLTPEPLPNPGDVRAQAGEGRIDLSWDNPEDPRFAGIRIVRSETFFPKDETDGVPVYEGAGQSYADRDVAVGRTYYYAVFSLGKEGELSSGALARGRIAPPGEIAVKPASPDPFADISESKNIDARIAALVLGDFEFIQDGRVLSVLGNTVAIDGSKNLTVRIRYEDAPEVLKSIAFTLSDPDDPKKVFPFLLRVNADKTSYEATVGPLGRTGRYGLSIVILDFENHGLKRIRGSLQALAIAAAPISTEAVSESGSIWLFAVPAIFVVFLALIVWLVRRSRRQAEENAYIHNV